jgi:hypothetical protein
MSAFVVLCFLLAEAYYAKSGGGTRQQLAQRLREA